MFPYGPESDFGWTAEGSWEGRKMPGLPWGLVLVKHREMLMAVTLTGVSENLQTSANHLQRLERCPCSMISGFMVGPGWVRKLSLSKSRWLCPELF